MLGAPEPEPRRDVSDYRPHDELIVPAPGRAYAAAVPHLVYYAAVALDGRIAGEEDDLSFLETLKGAEVGYDEFFAAVDSLVMGARTWHFVVRHGSWPYGERPAWVVTNEPRLEPLAGARVEPFAGDVRGLLPLLDERGLRRTWLVGGGAVAAQLLAADALDELDLTVAPTLVGRGPSLADGEFPLRRFRLASVDRVAGDAVRLRYERLRAAAEE